MKLLLLSVVLCSFFTAPAYSAYPPGRGGSLQISRLFSDHMVLQQKSKVNFWGSSLPGRQIVLVASWGQGATVVADARGHWKTRLLTPGAGGPYTIRISNADTGILLKDVLVGEVWLASGQSNMDIPLKGWPPGDTIQRSQQEIADARYPEIRFLKIPFGTSAHPLDTLAGQWTALTPETAAGYSATAYFYARKLHRELGVPVGILQSSIGGTPVEAWTSKEGLSGMGDFDQEIKGLDDPVREAAGTRLNSNTPTVLFNAMIHPLIPYSIKGVIWYQGESNVGRAEQYKRLFPALIRDWRKQWGEVLPFYYVQLAPYLYSAADQKGQAPKLRDAQSYGLRLPGTGMVSTLDIGYLKTAHPPYKQEVGDRLARLALVKAYGRKMVASGPLFKSARVSGQELIIEFDATGGGLAAAPGGLYNFEVAGADKAYVKADARVVNDRVLVNNPSISNPVYVRYAWSDSSRASLFNKEGLPAATFTSESQQAAPDTLPGKGLRQFDFFYAGEGKARNMYIIRNGRITWSYIDTAGRGEISDAILLSNGNILFAHQFGVTLIDSNKKVLWHYDAPEGYETHTAQLIGKDHVVFVQNGNPAKVLVMNIPKNEVVKSFVLPFKSGTHGQIRHARLTDAGTLLVAHMDLGKVCEYDITGKELLSIDVPSVWSAVPLKNGHILVASNQGFVREISRSGAIVWDLPLTDIPGYQLKNPQLAQRLPNGHILINNWFNQWSSTLDAANAPVQAIEVTQGKKIVWALRSWAEPVNLGPATTIQILNGPRASATKVHFGDIY